ncbi:MAG: hypothetical protein N2257_09940 [Thermodesulfovibrionales bacterium]|nr:hypothetical protein [Thermodesulfovibrionales bacterium]
MKKYRIGIFKLTSCDGCQLAILNLEEYLLDLFKFYDIVHFREGTDRVFKGTFDISIIEGSVTTKIQQEEIFDIRERSRKVITIGACATSGGIQALRNWARLGEFKQSVYPSPELIDVLSISTPVSEHIYVDYELWGCPVSTEAVEETLLSFVLERTPRIPVYSLCMECKKKGIPCILVSCGEPCLGPVTKAGCGALCPSFKRPCYGCFGPRDGANLKSLIKIFEELNITEKEFLSLIDKMNSYAYRKSKIGHE